MPQLLGELQGAREIRSRFSRAPMLMRQAAEETLQVATLVAEGAAKENAPIDKGLLRGSIHSDIRGDGFDMIGVVGTNLEYAPYQEFGTGIYGPKAAPITPKQGKFLVFRGKSGNLVFARSVAGSRARKFMAKGLQAVKDNMGKIRAAGIAAARKNLGF